MGSTYVYKSKWLPKRRWDVDFGCFYTSILFETLAVNLLVAKNTT